MPQGPPSDALGFPLNARAVAAFHAARGGYFTVGGTGSAVDVVLAIPGVIFYGPKASWTDRRHVRPGHRQSRTGQEGGLERLDLRLQEPGRLRQLRGDGRGEPAGQEGRAERHRRRTPPCATGGQAMQYIGHPRLRRRGFLMPRLLSLAVAVVVVLACLPAAGHAQAPAGDASSPANSPTFSPGCARSASRPTAVPAASSQAVPCPGIRVAVWLNTWSGRVTRLLVAGKTRDHRVLWYGTLFRGGSAKRRFGSASSMAASRYNSRARTPSSGRRPAGNRADLTYPGRQPAPLSCRLHARLRGRVRKRVRRRDRHGQPHLPDSKDRTQERRLESLRGLQDTGRLRQLRGAKGKTS